jgi:predicted nuclease with TOPRIM domain
MKAAKGVEVIWTDEEVDRLVKMGADSSIMRSAFRQLQLARQEIVQLKARIEKFEEDDYRSEGINGPSSPAFAAHEVESNRIKYLEEENAQIKASCEQLRSSNAQLKADLEHEWEIQAGASV